MIHLQRNMQYTSYNIRSWGPYSWRPSWLGGGGEREGWLVGIREGGLNLWRGFGIGISSTLFHGNDSGKAVWCRDASSVVSSMEATDSLYPFLSSPSSSHHLLSSAAHARCSTSGQSTTQPPSPAGSTGLHQCLGAPLGATVNYHPLLQTLDNCRTAISIN